MPSAHLFDKKLKIFNFKPEHGAEFAKHHKDPVINISYNYTRSLKKSIKNIREISLSDVIVAYFR